LKLGNKGGGLYSKWFKNFTLTVFIQTFHAFFLMFVMQFLSGINATRADNALGANDGILGMMAIVGMMAIIKFEKLFKQLFGIEDSMAGDMKGAGAKMFMGMQAAKGLYDTTAAPFKKQSEAKRKINTLGNRLGLTDEQKGKYAKMSSGTSTAGSTNDPSNTGTGNGGSNQNSRQATEMYNNASTGNANSSEGQSNSRSSNNSAADQAIIDDRNERVREKRQKLIEEYNDAVRDSRMAGRDRWLNAAGTIASMSMGLGATDEWHEAAKVADLINKPVSAATTRMAEKQENRDAYTATGDPRYNEKSMKEAIKDGFKNITIENIVDKSRNADGKVSPLKLTIEAAKLPYTNTKAAVKSSGKTDVVEIDNTF
jgi:hypothetical protein